MRVYSHGVQRLLMLQDFEIVMVVLKNESTVYSLRHPLAHIDTHSKSEGVTTKPSDGG